MRAIVEEGNTEAQRVPPWWQVQLDGYPADEGEDWATLPQFVYKALHQAVDWRAHVRTLGADGRAGPPLLQWLVWVPPALPTCPPTHGGVQGVELPCGLVLIARTSGCSLPCAGRPPACQQLHLVSGMGSAAWARGRFSCMSCSCMAKLHAELCEDCTAPMCSCSRELS